MDVVWGTVGTVYIQRHFHFLISFPCACNICFRIFPCNLSTGVGFYTREIYIYMCVYTEGRYFYCVFLIFGFFFFYHFYTWRDVLQTFSSQHLMMMNKSNVYERELIVAHYLHMKYVKMEICTFLRGFRKNKKK